MKTESRKQKAESKEQRAESPDLEFYAVRLYVHRKGFWFAIGEAMSHNSGKSWALLQCGRTEAGWRLRVLG